MSAVEQATRRDELLVIAARLFAQYGYHGTGIRQIAAAADLQSATLYGHFKNKPSIFLDIIRPYLERSFEVLKVIAASDAPASQRLTEMVTSSIDVNLQHRDAFVVFSNDWKHIQITPDLAELVVLVNKIAKIWSRAIDEGIADGTLPPDVDPRQVSWVLYAAITGMVDDRHAGMGSSIAPPVDLLLRVLADGLWRTPTERRGKGTPKRS